MKDLGATILLSSVVLAWITAPSHADEATTPLAAAKKLTTAIKNDDRATIATMLVGATVPKNFKKGTVKLATLKEATEWLESGPGLETKGGAKCSGNCCTYDDNGGQGWGDIPSHPQKVCFANGKVTTLKLIRGSP